jgi:hypothetical protein
MPWQSHPFTISCEADGKMPQSDLGRLIITSLQAAPDELEFAERD